MKNKNITISNNIIKFKCYFETNIEANTFKSVRVEVTNHLRFIVPCFDIYSSVTNKTRL